MNAIEVGFRGNRIAYRPGETLEGAVHWNMQETPEAVEVRLLWFTRGKGTEDIDVIATQGWNQPGQSGVQSFSFVLPEEPWSFSGRLVSLVWAVEAVALPSKGSHRLEFLLGASDRPIQLDNSSPS